MQASGHVCPNWLTTNQQIYPQFKMLFKFILHNFLYIALPEPTGNEKLAANSLSTKI